MHKIKRLQVQGFRRLRSLDLEMRPLMVMIGANGVGKTSFLDAVQLLSASAFGRLQRTLSDMGGISETLTREHAEELSFRTELEVQDFLPLEYELQVRPSGQTYAIAGEKLSQQKPGYPGPFVHLQASHGNARYFDTDAKKLLKPEWEYNAQETALSQVPKMFQQPEELRRTLCSVTPYHVLDVGRRAPVKLPQQMKPTDFPGTDGEDLISFLYTLSVHNKDRYDAIKDALAAGFPGFEALNFPPVAAGMLSMTWKEKHFKSPLYAHQLSEGTLRFLWLVSLLQSPSLSTITMIDEPEVSLHPELLRLLADLLREASRRTQIMVATHSDRLIRFLDPKEVLVLDMDEEGFTTAAWADSLDLEAWLKDYTLDEAWQMGRLGGRA